MFDLAHANTPVSRTSPSRRTPRANLEPAIASYAEIDGLGMGLLSTGEPYLTQRGLAVLCGVQNAHIGKISRDWLTDKPRILAIEARLGFTRQSPHRVLSFQGRRLFAYDMAIVHAILDYYALDAGSHIQAEAIRNRARYAAGGLKSHILSAFATPETPAEPIRFVPTRDDDVEDVHAVTALLTHIWALYVLSFWMAVNYIDELRQRLAKAPWNRLGLYLPLEAFLEIQAEVVRRHSAFSFK